MAKITLTDLSTLGPSAITVINSNNALIEAAIEKRHCFVEGNKT